jgi:hypothetical protein
MKARRLKRSVLVGLLPATLLAVVLLAVAACRKNGTGSQVGQNDPEPPGPAWFEEITATSGVKWTYYNGEHTAPKNLTILESLGGGIALLDYDGDGLLDIFIPGGGLFEGKGKEKRDIVGWPCKLYRNRGNNKFEDVTAKAGLDKLAGGKPWFYTHAGAVGDFNRDGWPDLLVTGWRQVALFKNVPVDPNDPKKGRKFVDVTAGSGLDKGIDWGTSAAWADLDGDGWPDLYLCQYADWSWKKHPACTYDGKTPDVCPPKQFHGLKHKVFRNNKNGTFTDQSESAGLLPGGPDASKGLGVIIVDVNDDRKPDVYVANDTVDNFLYINESRPGQIRFKEVGLASGTARDDHGQANGSMGVGAGDYDRSGRPSIWVANYENELHALYKNECRPGLVFFNFQTQAAGIAAIGQIYVGWGTSFVDFDLDGWEDLFVANGHAIRFPKAKGVTRKQKPVLLRNMGNGKFKAISKQVGSYGETEHLARGVGFGDLDNDGRVDMVINHTNEPVSILRNVAGKGHHWLGVRLVGKDHACTVGAKLQLKLGGETLTRFETSGGSYCSSNDPRHVFGLGTETKAGALTITWPDGKQQVFKDLAVDRYHRITQDKDRAEVMK